MTMPGAAFNGVSYPAGTSFGGELAKLAAGLVAGRKQAEDAARAEAMQQALLQLKQQGVANEGRGLDLTAERDKANAAYQQGELGVAQGQLGLGNRKLDADVANNEADRGFKGHEGAAERANRLRIAEMQTAAEVEAAKQRAAAGGAGGLTVGQDDTGPIIIDKHTHTAVPVTYAPTGEAPTGAAGQAPSHDTSATAQRVRGRANATEKQMGMMAEAEAPSADRVIEYYKSRGYQPPNTVSAMASHFVQTDPLGWKGIAAMKVIAAQDPEYASVLSNMIGTVRALTTAIHGKRTNEENARSMLVQLMPLPGEPPASVQSKMDRLSGLMHALEHAAGRGLSDEQFDAVLAGQPMTPTPAAAPAAPPTGGKKYVLPDGTVIE